MKLAIAVCLLLWSGSALGEIVSVPVANDMPPEFRRFGGCLPTSEQLTQANITKPNLVFYTVTQTDPKYKGFSLKNGQGTRFTWEICSGDGLTPVMPGFWAYFNGNMTGTLTSPSGQEWDLVVAPNNTGYKGKYIINFVNPNPTTVIACGASSNRGPRVESGTWTAEILSINASSQISNWGFRFESWYPFC